MSGERRAIDREDWVRRISAHCRTISGRYWPSEPAEITEYACTAQDFIAESSYVVQITSRDGSRLVLWDDHYATVIRIEDFAKNPEFVEGLLGDWDNDTPVCTAELIAQRCSSCGRTLVIDGVHRIVRIATQPEAEVQIRVTEIAGPSWPPGMPDMKTVCACRSAN